MAGASCAWAWQATKNTANSAPKKRAYVRRVSGNRDGFCIHPFVASPYFLCESAHPGEVTRQRPVARLYASANFSVNESPDGSRRTASGLSTTRELARRFYFGCEPVIRISTSLLALSCQSGPVATLETPISARSRSNGSRSLRMSPLFVAAFTSASIAPVT